MHPIRTLAAGLFLVLAALAGPAFAQQAAGVGIGQLRYTLVDLDPDDGIAPWIGLNAYASQADAHAYDQAGNDIDGVEIDHAGVTGFDDDDASLHADTRDAAASVTLTLHSGWGYVSAGQVFRFLLSPHTRVVFSADADAWARPEAPGVSWPTAIAELYGSLHGIGDGERFTDTLRIEDGNLQRTLSVTAASEGDWVDGRIAFDAYAVAESHALPVPEPAMPDMLLGGLGGLGVLALAGRRGRQRRRTSACSSASRNTLTRVGT